MIIRYLDPWGIKHPESNGISNSAGGEFGRLGTFSGT